MSCRLLALSVALYLAASGFFAACSGGPVKGDRVRQWPPSVQQGAEALASERYPGDSESRKCYEKELLDLFDKIRGAELAVVYNTGGFGGTTMAVDKDWSGIVLGIQATLQEMGFSATIVEHQRSEYGVWGTVTEIAELVRGYPHKAAELASRMEFLLHYQPVLKVVITGRSHGAVFGNQALKLLVDEPRAYAILAGTPFWYHSDFNERALVINYNGVQPDAFHTGDCWTILKANLHLPWREPSPGGAIQILKWYINMPGHEYTWQYPRVRSEIENFLGKISQTN